MYCSFLGVVLHHHKYRNQMKFQAKQKFVSSSQGGSSDTREAIELPLMPITKEKYVSLLDSELAAGGAKKLSEYVMETAKS